MKKMISIPINGRSVRMTIEDGRELFICLRRLFENETAGNLNGEDQHPEEGNGTTFKVRRSS